MVARLSPTSPPIGLAVWHPPLDRTLTGGDPLPQEISFSTQENARERSELEKEAAQAINSEFIKRYRAEQAVSGRGSFIRFKLTSSGQSSLG